MSHRTRTFFAKLTHSFTQHFGSSCSISPGSLNADISSAGPGPILSPQLSTLSPDPPTLPPAIPSSLESPDPSDHETVSSQLTVSSQPDVRLSSPPTQALPSRVEDLSCRDLTGLIKCDDWSINGIEHSGGFADICVGYLTEEDKTIKVAIKVLRTSGEESVTTKVAKMLIRETAAWKQLHHHNILEFLGLAPDHGRHGCPALISPYCERGTATRYLALHPDLATKLLVITGTAEGLKYLHQKDVVHGDLKPSNVLIHGDGRPLICDFGCSKILTSTGFTTKPAGVCRYQAPELLTSGNGPSKSSDVYALAATTYEFWTGLKPFHAIHQDNSVSISIVMRDARPEYPNPAPFGTELVWKVLEDSWRTEPESRLDATAIVARWSEMNDQLRLGSQE